MKNEESCISCIHKDCCEISYYNGKSDKEACIGCPCGSAYECYFPYGYCGNWEPLDDKIKATELEFLKWFYCNCNFGWGHKDVIKMMKESFIEETEKELPDSYPLSEEE